MQDWSVAVGLIVVAISWVQIFMDYRKRLMKIMPTVTEIANLKSHITSRISSAETIAENIKMSLEE